MLYIFLCHIVSDCTAAAMTKEYLTMTDTSAHGPARAAGSYDARPWLKHYAPYVPPELTPRFASGLEMFLETVKASPEQPAIHYFDQTISYGDLDRQSSALAAALKERGVKRGDRIALYLQNVPQFLVGMYGVWKVGAIVVPCNPMLKQQELAYQLNDSGAKGLICLESLYGAIAHEVVAQTKVEFVITTSELDMLGSGAVPALLAASKKQRFDETLDLMDLLARFDGASIEPATLAPDETAFLTYTSGTTGRPKGAMNTHANVVFNSTVYQQWMQLDSNDVVVGVAPFFHITGLIAHLTVAALAAMPIITFYRFDPAEMLRLTEKWRGTFTVAAITVFIALLNHPDIRTRDLSAFKKVYSGGAPVSPAIVEEFEKVTGAYIHNIYGLTETTSPSHATPMGARAPVDPDSGALSVGVPIPNTLCRVVDVATGEDLPIGEVGELITKGPEIVAGYWEKPEETAYAIRDGYLYTGDVAKMDADGWFYLVDRKKDMIIASGFKVWPREVEDVLYQHPAVREAGVVGAPDPYRGETVVAYVSLKSGYEGKVTPEELIEFCKQRMANYKYPRRVEIMEELPKTPTGKFLRRELRGMAHQ
jgi:long-chain acyl-CoA synthetase